MRSDFEAPTVDMPQNWTQDNSQQSVVIDKWWMRFDDPVLDQIIAQVLVKNNDLALATLTLQKARLQAAASFGYGIVVLT